MKTKHQLNLSAPVIQSGDQTQNNPIRRKWSALAFGGFLFTSVFALSALPVEAQCEQYDVSGQWTIEQGSYRISVALNQNGKTVSGTASQVHGKTTGHGDVHIVQGQVNGTVEGDSFHVQINWSGGGAGDYSGTIGGANLGMAGTTHDKNKPTSTASWLTNHHFDCADAAPTAPAGPKPIRHSGKARPDANDPEKTSASSSDQAQPPLTKLSAASAADWVGSWDTTTDQGGHFELVLEQDGDKISGTFHDLNGNPQYDGTLVGTLSGRTLTYRFAQLKATGTGLFKLDQSKQKITGNGVTLQGAAKTRFFWSGSKTN
jgi:hypothetical protein